MIEEIAKWITGGNDRRGDTYHECRRCGSTVSGDATVCATCGSDDIATVSL